MKKIFSLLLVLVIVFSIAGCAKKTTDKGTTDNDKTTNKKITIWAWDPNFNIAIMEKAKEIYKKDNADVEIEIVDFAKEDLEQKLHTNLASGMTEGLPDIVLIEDYNAQKYLQSYPGSFEDLTGKIKHDDFAKYKVQVMTLDGKIYGVPFDSGVAGFYYRKDYLEKAGYSEEDLKNITWDKYIEIGKAVKEKTGKAMLAFDANDGGLMRTMLQSAGSWYFDKDGKVNIANNEVLKEAVKTYKAIVDAGIIKPTSGWGEWVGGINSGDTASVVTGVWITGSVKAEDSQKGNWRVAPIPKLNVEGATNYSNLGGSSWYVLSSSKSKETAIDFMNKIYGQNDDFYQQILVNQGAVGTYIPSQSGDSYQKEDEFFGGQKVYQDFSEWMKNIPAINYGTYTYEADAAIFGFMSEVYNGASIDDALKKAEEQLNSQIQK